MNKEETLNSLNIIITNELSLLRQNKKTWKLKMGKLDYPNQNSLILIYENQKDQKIKNEMILSTRNRIISSNEEVFTSDGTKLITFYTILESELLYISEIPLLFSSLCFLQNNDYAIKCLQEISILKTNNLIWIFLIFLLDSKLFNFNINETNKLIEIPYSLSTGLNKILREEFLRKASSYGARQIDEKLKNINIEINQDKLLLIEKIKKNKLNPKFSNFLESIDDNQIYENEYALSGMISNFRNFWEKILIEIAEKLSKNLKIEIGKTETSKISNCRVFLKKYLEFSDKDNSLISKFVDISLITF